MEELKPLFPVDFTENGDTTSLAIEKHIKELNNLYADLTDVYEKILTANADAAAMLKRLDAMGNVVSRNTGTAKDEVPVYGDNKLIDANISGKAAGLSTTLAVTNGGTGMTDLTAFRNSIGLGYTLGALPIANGGTGASSANAALNAIGGMMKITGSNVRGFVYSGNRVLTPNEGNTWLVVMLISSYYEQIYEGAVINRYLTGANLSGSVVQRNTVISQNNSNLQTVSGFCIQID